MQGGATISGYGARVQPAARSNFELWAWLFMRISGVLLLVLALGHLAIMHVINTVDVVNYKFVAERWGTFFWRAYDLLLLVLALVHGLNGMRVVIDDYVHGRGARVWLMLLLYTGGMILLVIGALVIVTFVEQT